MSEKFPVSSAKTSKDLGKACDDAKKESARYGFTAVTALEQDVVGKAMAPTI